MTDLGILLQDVIDTALLTQWRSADFERSALEDLDRLFGQYLAKHEHALDVWRHRGGTAQTLVKALRAFDRLITTILSNNNLG
jgi:hypothetical protein